MATGCVQGELPPNEEVWKPATEAVDEQNRLESRGATSHSTYSKSSLPDTVFTSSLKPVLPPKPQHGPPVYREPPRPFQPGRDVPAPSSAEKQPSTSQQPDVCAMYSSKRFEDHEDKLYHEPSLAQVGKAESVRSKPVPSGMQAWAQEQKTPGTVVGERLSSLQRKLRSLLTQSQKNGQKEYPIEEIPKSDHPHHIASTSEGAHPSSDMEGRSYRWQNPHPESYLSQAPIGSFMAPHGAASYAERHPFEPDTEAQESEVATDPLRLRDTCSKLFSREPKTSWSSYLNPRNSYTNNIKSTMDFDKLTPKQTIGKSCQEIKAVGVSASPAPPLASQPPSGMPTVSSAYHKPEPPGIVHHENLYHSPIEIYNERSGPGSHQEAYANHPKGSQRTPSSNMAVTECGDVSDQYKSSSESGRGTMHSNSLRDTKSLASARSSRISGASHLDTSLDSDQSTGCALWDNSSHFNRGQASGPASAGEENKSTHGYETVENIDGFKKDLKEVVSDDEDLSPRHASVCPQPPVSPPHSSPASVNSSPTTSPRTKYKLSSSTTALSSYQSKSLEGKQSECGVWRKSAPHSTAAPPSTRKKSSSRNTSSSGCRQWSTKNKAYSTRNSSGNHRLGHSCKKSRSPPMVKHAASALAVPGYVDYADAAEWTSTTTGLDGESLLDDPDDLSSDISMSTSTVDPVEMTMIRKQLEGLENMYSEIVNILGAKGGSFKGLPHLSGSSLEHLGSSRCQNNRSLPSVLARSSSFRGAHSHSDKRGLFEKRRGKEIRYGSASKRLQRLESHVVTLARSVAHLSSEMRTQHLLVQELEHMRQDVTWVNERLRLLQLAQGYADNPVHDPVRKDACRKDVSELLNPDRAKKLTKFFGDEPPLIRQFLKRLGYEKYATNFENEKIGIMELPYLTEERLQKLGVPMGPRMRILQEARTYCQQNQYKVYIV